MEIQEVFKFCPRCGANFFKKTKFLECRACGLSYYLNPKPAQSVILKNDKDQYLFVIRALEPRKGYLDFPGGFVDANEDFEGSARREVKEELGIDIGELKYLISGLDEYLFQGINYKVANVAYTGQLPKEAKLKPADDVSGFEFYNLNDIPLERLAWKTMHEMIAELKSIETN